MARKPQQKTLNIWMNNQLVGYWSLSMRSGQEFRYADSWVDSPWSRPLSLSLPLQPGRIPHKHEVVEPFFENLLPDSEDIKKRLQIKYAATSTRAFELLTQIGKDCVGAIQVLRPGDPPSALQRSQGKKVNDEEIESILINQTHSNSFLPDNMDDFRISIAGAQEKTAFLKHRGVWKIPKGATPTTHIFKLPMGIVGGAKVDLTTSVENEWLCLQIAQAYGISVAQSEIQSFGSQKVLVVTRFDRKYQKENQNWLRLPMEDMCQALGIGPLQKYQSEGGPGIADVMKLLMGSVHNLNDRITFFKSQVLFWMLAAPDGHAKNFSIFLNPGGAYQLTPLYDIISAYPIMGKGKNQIPSQKLKMAMALQGKNKHYHWDRITKDHFLTTARLCGLSLSIAKKIIMEIKQKTEDVILIVKKSVPAGFPNIAEPIFSGLRQASKRL